jgi:hypothetical protein
MTFALFVEKNINLKTNNNMKKSEKYLEIILQTNKWFENKTKQLKFISENKDASKILIEGENGEKIELPDELKKGFILGIITALDVLGDFPIKITKTNDNE